MNTAKPYPVDDWGYVCFMVNAERSAVKIGWTRDPWRRVGEVANETPSGAGTALLAALPGRKHEERAMHERFGAHRLHGEWFDFDTVTAHLEEVLTATYGRKTGDAQ
jgi:DNA-binding IclR family transcriptional regulator